MKMDRIEDILSAIAFAEEGEPDKAREILKGRKTVLLAVSDRTSRNAVLRYAINTSKRVQADMAILYISGRKTQGADLDEMVREAEKEGVRCSAVRREGCMKGAILDYTEKRRDVLFVVVGSAPELDIDCGKEGTALSEAWKKLKCPLVVVSTGETPSVA